MQHKNIFFIKLLIMTILLNVNHLADADPFKKKGDIFTGEVFSFESKVLKENRDIYISFPENYEHSVHNYPVIFVLDGEYLFPLASSIVKLQSSRNYMPESIVVGIPNNTDKRMHMAMEIFDDEGEPFFYGEGIGQANKYLTFFREELIPNLEKKYRINNHRSIIGMSPTFGPVLEAFWSQPDMFRGYIVLAAEIGKRLKSGETIAEKLLSSSSMKGRAPSGIYIGTSGKDIEKRGIAEAELYSNIGKKLPNRDNRNVNYEFEIIPDEDHYGMVVKGIHNGLRTIYSKDNWDISYRKFWRSNDPTKSLEETYKQLSLVHGFDVVPVESAFYSVNNLVKTAEILGRQNRKVELEKWLNMATKYYPNSPRLLSMFKELNNE